MSLSVTADQSSAQTQNETDHSVNPSTKLACAGMLSLAFVPLKSKQPDPSFSFDVSSVTLEFVALAAVPSVS